MQLCEILLVEYPEKVNENAGPIHRAVLYCVTGPRSAVRRNCIDILKKIIGSLRGISIARSLVKELQALIEANKVVIKSEGDDNNQNENNYWAISHSLVECFITLSSSNGLTTEDFQLLAVDIFLPIHHPLIVKLASDLWIKIVKHYKHKPKVLVTQWSEHFKKIVIEEYKNTAVS